MARPLRIEYPGAWYHITSRGSEQGEIFRDDKDRIRFLEALKESSESYKVGVHCYVLMSNHFHFLLRTREANLSRFMQRFNTAYTAYFNLRHHRAGHLYQGRFKAIVVEADEYLKELSRYLHLNPVRLKKYEELPVKEKAEILKEYKWSSLRGYMGLGKRDEFVTYGDVLGYMGGDTREGRRRYGEFVISGLYKGMKNPFAEAEAGAVLGTESFAEWIRKTFIDGRQWLKREQPQVRLIERMIPVGEIARVVGEAYGVKPEELLKGRSVHREARCVLIELSYRMNTSGKPLQKIGDELGGISGAAITNNRKRFREQMARDHKLEKLVKQICSKLVSV
jgi:REP element-mobilizing transposase RayT